MPLFRNQILRFWISGISFVCLFFFSLSSGIKLSSWLIKLDPDEFKVITSPPIKPRYCCKLSLGGHLVSRANSAAHQKHNLGKSLWSNGHGRDDWVSRFMPFLWQRRTRGDVALQNLPYKSFKLVIHSSRSLPLRWDSGAGETYSHLTALPSLGSPYKFLDVSRDEWAKTGVLLQFCFLHFRFWTSSSPILLLLICCPRVTIRCLFSFIPFSILPLSLLFKKDC